MRLFSLGFFLGVFGLTFLQKLPGYYFSISLIVFSLLLLLLLKQLRKYSVISQLISLALAACLGFGWVLLYANWQLQNPIPKNIENQNVVVQGFIASIPEQETAGIRFLFIIKKLQQGTNNYPLPGKVRLTWEGQSPNLQVGDQWQLEVHLKRPHSTFNPGGFDEEEWLFAQDIHATGYVRFGTNNLLLNSKWYHAPLDRFRQKLAEKISQQLVNNPMTGFITALAVGVRNNITPLQWQVLRNTGTNHLMAIAGLHIGMLTAMIFFLVNIIWRLFPKLLLRVPAGEAAAFAALIAAICYSALAGYSLPTQRALIMVGIFFSAMLLRRNLPPLQGILLALIIILIYDPLAVLSSSFWLSFCAVALIIYGISARLKILKWHWVKMQWILTIGLIPLTILFFQQISFDGLLANFIAIPVVGFLVLPLTLCGSLCLFISPYLGGLILKFVALILSWTWFALTKIAMITWLQRHVAIWNVWVLLAMIIGVILLLAPRGLSIRRFGVIGFLPLIFWHPATSKLGEIYFTLLDVGQGLSAVVQTQHHILVYDTGAKYSDDFDLGDAVVVPYLRTLGITKIDMLVISHGDNDHSGGAQSVMKEIQVQQIFTSIPEKFPSPITHACAQNQHWQWDGVDFNFLYPPVGQPYLDNNSSCVLKISTGNNSILLTGDIEKKSEQYLLKNEQQLLPATIIVAPHHGSISSSTADFVNAVKPIYVLFPVGYFNRYHFPNPKIITRYQQEGAMCYNSIISGAITFIVNNSPIKPPQQYRLNHGHFWNLVDSQ